jgi:hypothetical protein
MRTTFQTAYFNKKMNLILFFCLTLIFSGCAQNAPMQNKNAGGAGITEKEVKDYITHYWTKDCRSFEECTVTFETGVRINPKERHSFANGITVYAYPVKVDYTTATRNKTINGKWSTAHHRGGVLYFFRNSFGDWEMQSEHQDLTFD